MDRSGVVETFAGYLRDHNLPVTQQRMDIAKVLLGSDRHLSVEDVAGELNQRGQRAGLATVYRVLTQFEAAGLVTRHHFEGTTAVFELNEGQHHDHIVCVDCGRVAEFSDESIEERQRQIASRMGFSITDHSLTLHGHCLREICPYRAQRK